MFLVVVVIVLGAAAAVGSWLQRRLFGQRDHDDPRSHTEGLNGGELVVPVRTLAALLLAFVLVSVFQSYQAAGDQAATEAGAVLSMAEASVLLQPEARTEVLGRLVCYSRSVQGPDWHAQADGGRLSPVTDAAADAIAGSLATAAQDPRNSLAIGAVLGGNDQRIQSRIERFDEGRPAVPDGIYALLLVTIAIALGGLAALGHPGVRRQVQLSLLVGSTLVFGLTLVVVQDLDHPYSGPAKVEPTAMRDITRRIANLPGGNATPPCDQQGRALTG